MSSTEASDLLVDSDEDEVAYSPSKSQRLLFGKGSVRIASPTATKSSRDRAAIPAYSSTIIIARKRPAKTDAGAAARGSATGKKRPRIEQSDDPHFRACSRKEAGECTGAAETDPIIGPFCIRFI